MRPFAATFVVVTTILLPVLSMPLLAEDDNDTVSRSAAESKLDVKNLMSQAARGDARASFLLGAAYASGRSVAKNDKEAVYWFRNAAKKGLAEAQYNLAVIYATGTAGVKYNPATAAKWYKRAAEQGLPEAQYNLGTMYGTGRGVKRDDKLAAEWLRKAAEQGMGEAAFNIGVLYEHGQGVPLDKQQALAWYARAADAGYTRAGQRERMLRGDDADPRSVAQQKLVQEQRKRLSIDRPDKGDRQKAKAKTSVAATASSGGEIRSTEWFADLDPDQYTLQILSLTREASSRAFIRDRQLQDKAAYFAVSRDGQTWYAVTYGLYDSLQEAEAAANSLPDVISELKPWVRNTGRIQQSMLRHEARRP